VPTVDIAPGVLERQQGGADGVDVRCPWGAEVALAPFTSFDENPPAQLACSPGGLGLWEA